MSMNGDGLAFLYDTRHQLSSHSGAPISTSVRLPFVGPNGERRTLMVMSGRVPMAAMHFAGAALAVAGEALRDDDQWPRTIRVATSSAGSGSNRPAWRTRPFVHVQARRARRRGRTARFTERGAVIDWENYLDDPVMQFADRRLRAVGETRRGEPSSGTWQSSLECGASAYTRSGAVESAPQSMMASWTTLGRVFDPHGGTYAGLRIADGSVLPGSLGVPPSLTISAFAERVAESMLQGSALD